MFPGNESEHRSYQAFSETGTWSVQPLCLALSSEILVSVDGLIAEPLSAVSVSNINSIPGPWCWDLLLHHSSCRVQLLGQIPPDPEVPAGVRDHSLPPGSAANLSGIRTALLPSSQPSWFSLGHPVSS